MSLVRTHQRDASEAPLEHRFPPAPPVVPSLHSLLAPVREDLDAVSQLLEATLHAEVPTANAVSAYVARTKGKGIRPALVLLAAKATGAVTPEVRSAAAAIELVQTSTLLHDDVIDASALRRGVPSVNAQWGNDIAVLMGDVLFTHAISLFVETGSIPVMRAAARQTRLMIEGEVFARDLRRNPDFREATYFDLIHRKTGALMSFAAEVGPLLTGASQATARHMRSYGALLGAAFQIADDVLDVVGDPSIVGKPTGQDLRQGTITLPLIRAIDNATDGDGQRVQDMVLAGIDSDEHWEAVRQFVTAHEGVESSLRTAREFAFQAREELAHISPSPARASLDGMLDYVISRRI